MSVGKLTVGPCLKGKRNEMISGAEEGPHILRQFSC